MKHLGHQGRRADRADAGQPSEGLSFVAFREGRGLVSRGGLAIRIERLHVLQNQVQALKRTRELGPQIRTERSTIAGPQL